MMFVHVEPTISVFDTFLSQHIINSSDPNTGGQKPVVFLQEADLKLSQTVLQHKYILCIHTKQDSEANIWARERWEWGVEKAPQ